jgi:hypothetical protein
MPVDPVHPDLDISLPLGPFAPRAARYHVAQLDRPSPDLRDAVVLLCSELVTQAVEQWEAGSIELRVWMPSDVVRVEVRGSVEVTLAPPAHSRAYGSALLDQIADRWSVDTSEDCGCTWFEIDRHPVTRPSTPAGVA